MLNMRNFGNFFHKRKKNAKAFSAFYWGILKILKKFFKRFY